VLEVFGKHIVFFVQTFGEMVLMVSRSFKMAVRGDVHWRNVLQQMSRIGVDSTWLVLVTAAFVSAVFTMQVTTEFSRLGAMRLIGGIIGIAVWRELAPVFTGIVIAGRVGASISAELGAMMVTEQVDALKAMAVDPLRYLITPRILAAMIMVPLLTGLADTVGFFSGLLIAMYAGKINPNLFFQSAQNMLAPSDVWGGLIKACLFGMIVAAVACSNGLQATEGAQSVGNVTTRTVVTSFVVIFVLNYILSVVLYS
jgi:phospholipid/cholesterol/gamma-HCH transport system permease protein